MHLANGPNWLATRLQTAGQQLAMFNPKNTTVNHARNQLEACQLELFGQTSVSESGVLGCLEQLQPIMAALKADQTVEGQMAYATLAHTVYGRHGSRN